MDNRIESLERRMDNVEADIVAIKLDIAVLKATSATKADLAKLEGELKSAIAGAKAVVIIWVSSAVILAQVLPAILKLLLG